MITIATLIAGVVLAAPFEIHLADRCLLRPFHRITRTSETGEIIGVPDPQDWGCLNGSTDLTTGGGRRRHASAEGVPVPPPTAVCFEPAYPNPAPSQVRLGYALPQSMHVTLVIYARSAAPGRREALPIRSLLDSDSVAGRYDVTWDLRDDQGALLAPGIYRAVLTTAGGSLCGDIQVQ